MNESNYLPFAIIHPQYQLPPAYQCLLPDSCQAISVVIRKTMIFCFPFRIRRRQITSSVQEGSNKDTKTAAILAISGIFFCLLSIPDFYMFVLYSTDITRKSATRQATEEVIGRVTKLCHCVFGTINCVIYAFGTKIASRTIKRLCIN